MAKVNLTQQVLLRLTPEETKQYTPEGSNIPLRELRLQKGYNEVPDGLEEHPYLVAHQAKTRSVAESTAQDPSALLDDARREVASMLDFARSESQKIQADAKMEVNKIIDEAKTEARRIVDEAKQNGKRR